MLKVERTKKEEKLESGTITEASTKNGMLSILIKPRIFRPRASLKTSDSTSTDHSISSPNFHSEELQSVLELTMSK